MVTRTEVDPVTFAVVRNGLDAVARKVDMAFTRVGMHPLIYEAHDFAVAVFDERVNLLTVANDGPLAASLTEAVAGVVAEVGREGLRVGDMLLTSLPWLHGVHSADLVLVEPVFFEDRLVGFCVLREHVGDVGGASSLPTRTTDVFGEGLQVPPVKLYDGGELNGAVLEIVRANSRMPDMVVGNVLGGVSAVRIGSEALVALVEKHGEKAYHAISEQLLDHGERMMRAAIERIPDGVYTAEGALDDNGVELGVPVPIKLTITVEGSEITMDTSGSACEQRAPVNCHLPLTKAGVRTALRMFTDSQAPPNAGEHRPVTVIAPEGSIFNPSRTVASFWAMRTTVRLTALMTEALAEALPEVMPAGRSTDSGSSHALLRDLRTGRWTFSVYVGGAGGGAIHGADGPNAVYHQSAIRSVPLEVLEMRDPARRLRFGLDRDSGGPGRWRGGLGMVNEEEYLSDGFGYVACYHCSGVQPIVGMLGGLGPKSLGGVVFYAGSDHEIGPPDCRASDLPIEPGDRYVSWTAGGGGYGDPLERDLDALAWDLRNEYVSPGAACEFYGAVLTASGELDRAGTAARRRELAADAHDQPQRTKAALSMVGS